MRRRRASMPRTVVQSFKKVLNFAPTSQSAGKHNFDLVKGVDSTAAGQTGVTDADVPTGSVVRFIEIQFNVINLVSVAAFTWISIQSRRSGQSATVDPRVVGGNPQRNQVYYQMQRMSGPDQNNNYVIKFKVPAKYSRIREGDIWSLVVNSDQVTTDACQVIYKFYR